MRIESVKAHPFGPFDNQELQFGPGLTVVSGGNETGKSSWHAATSTALVGRRKGRSRKVDLDLTPHKPWDRDDWAVSCVVALDDGRRIRLVHNLAAGRSQAIDDITGADMTAELMAEGGVDASTLVGLNRLTLPLVSSVRQADILALSAAQAGDPQVAALRGLLQQSVSSRASADSTAEQAIDRLTQFQSSAIGTERKGSGKPLRLALDAVHAAESARDTAQSAWAAQRQVERDYAAQTQLVQRLQKRLDALSAEDHVARFFRARDRAQRAEALAAKAGAGPEIGADADLVERVQVVLRDRQSLSPVPAAPKVSSQFLREQLAALPFAPTGPLAPSPTMEQSAAQLETALAAQDGHRSQRPSTPEPPRSLAWSPAQLRSAAAAVSHPPAEAEAPQAPLLVMGAGLLVGLCLLGAGLLLPSLVALAAATLCLALVMILWARSGAEGSQPERTPAQVQHSAMLAALATDDLPADPQALEAEAQSREAHAAAVDALDSWLSTGRQLDTSVARASAALVAELDAQGIAGHVEPADALRAVEDFRVACARRSQDHDLQAQRLQVERSLGQVEAIEQQRQDASERLQRWRGQLEDAVAATGLPTGAGDEEMVGALQTWIAEQRQRSEAFAKAREARAALSEMVQDSSVDELLEHAQALRSVALDAGVDSSMLDDGASAGRAGAKPRPDRARLNQLNHDLRAAQQREAALSGKLEEATRALQGLAEVEEEVTRAQSEYDRLCRMGALVETTRNLLTRARSEVHRDIAPLIANATNDRLARISAGRYKQTRVNPEDLSVQVELADGSWRSAESLSHGTTEQIYLLARLAIAETVAATESCPLLLDDVTVHADADRTDALLDLLLELSADRQIIVFSQEEAVRSWAQASTATTIELPAI